MEENAHSSDEMTLIDVIKVLFKKWLLLLIALIVGAGTGALLGFAKNVDQEYYGTTVMFYVNPVKENADSKIPVYGSYGNNITETMVVLLESEYFAQEIIKGIPNAPEKEIDGKMNPAYAAYIKRVQQCTTFSNKDNSKPDEENQPNNIFYASISVKNDPDFANLLLLRLEDETVSFIEANMPVPDGYQLTKCVTISIINNIDQFNKDALNNSIIKAAILGGAATVGVTFIVAVILERYNKKRTYYD
jgi:hypothetical protein